MIKVLVFSCTLLLIHCTLPGGDWQQFDSLDNKFSIEFPGIPVLSESDVQSSFGPVVNYSVHYDETDKNTPEFLYYLDYMDLGRSLSDDSLVNSYFDNMIAATTTGRGLKKYNEKTIELNSYPGREYVIDLNKDHVVIKCRLYLVGERFYMLQVGTYDTQIEKPDINRFFNSFILH